MAWAPLVAARPRDHRAEDGAAAGSESGGARKPPRSRSNLWPRQLAELLPEVKLLINPTTTSAPQAHR